MNTLIFDIYNKNFKVSLTSNKQEISIDLQNILNIDSLLLASIKSLLELANCKVYDLNFIAIPEGPAFYTGLKILYSTLKGLVLPFNIPLISLDVFEILESQSTAKIIPIINSKNYTYYIKLNNEILSLPFEKIIEEVKTIYKKQKVLFSSFDNLFLTELKNNSNLVLDLDFEFLFADFKNLFYKKAMEKFNNKDFAKDDLEPKYIRNAV